LWVADAAAAIGEFAWRNLGISGAPPVTRTMVNLMFREVSVSDQKARRELGYVGHVGIEQGLAELAADHAQTVP
jgi:nucleoside-diphosphate-sugar epimerase